jgi:S-adenosylmethionine:tRNA ribosyltransferase-isomerase
MKAARAPRDNPSSARLLVVGSAGLIDSYFERLPDHLRPGDLLIVNDAATMPASFHGRDREDHPVEIRLLGQVDRRVWQAVAFGEGDWRTPTEDRPAPPHLAKGDEIRISPEFRARVLGEPYLSDRLLTLEFDLPEDELWRNLYRFGRPVQYSYMTEALKLWSVQNSYSSRPWASETPSAGNALTWSLLLALLRKGVEIAPLTHGAGLSSSGDAAIDHALPLPERYEIPAATWEAVQRAKNDGRRVIAVGTSVVRALESARFALSGVTNLKLGPQSRLEVTDALLSGTHDVTESHYQLLGAFLSESRLAKVTAHLEEENYLTHEFGDFCLIY